MQKDYAVTTVPDLQDDVALMLAARDDPKYFARIYERYFRRIYLYCLRNVDSTEEAEDLTSLVFVQAFRSLAHYRGGSVPAWLFRIAYGTIANHYRRAYREESIDAREGEMAADVPDALERIVQAETHHRLRQLVAALTPEEQDLLRLKIDAGLSSQEIGEILGKSPGAVRIQLHRIIKQLRERYRQQE